MPTLQELRAVDTLGFPRFTEKQAKPMVDMVRSKRLLESTPPPCEGTGIVIGGGGKYLSHAWVVCRHLRQLGCNLPIQVWHFGTQEMPSWAKPLFSKLGVQTVDTYEVLKKYPVREMGGWLIKNYAIMHCPWENVLYMDADCFATVNPELLFTHPEVQSHGSLFFTDVAPCRKSNWSYVWSGLTLPLNEWESGQYIVSKTRGWMGLRWASWLNEHSRVWDTCGFGDKHTLELGFRISEVPHIVSQQHEWSGWGISQQWQGKEWFRHCMGAKRGEHPWPDDIKPLFWEWDSLKG